MFSAIRRTGLVPRGAVSLAEGERAADREPGGRARREGVIPFWRAAVLAVPAMGAARGTGPFLTNWRINSPVLRLVACLPRRAWLPRGARRRRAVAGPKPM